MIHSKKTEKSDFRNLILWHSCRHLILELFEVTSTFPHSEFQGLANEIRNGGVAITSNIANIFKKQNELKQPDFFNLGIASSTSLKANLLSAKEKGLLNRNSHEHLTNEVKEIEQMLFTFVQNSALNFEFEPN